MILLKTLIYYNRYKKPKKNCKWKKKSKKILINYKYKKQKKLIKKIIKKNHLTNPYKNQYKNQIIQTKKKKIKKNSFYFLVLNLFSYKNALCLGKPNSPKVLFLILKGGLSIKICGKNLLILVYLLGL